MKSLLAASITLVSLGIVSHAAQAEDVLSKIGRAAEQTTQKVQEAKETRDVLTGQKAPEPGGKSDSGSTDPRKTAHDEVERKKGELKNGAAEKRNEVENHGQRVSDEKHRLNAERKAMKEQRKNLRDKNRPADEHKGDHEHKGSRD